jgi:hypothetical protein
VLTIGKIKCKLLSTEDALVVSWFDVAKLLVFTALIFVMLGPFYDQMWTYMHHATNTTDLYTQSDVDTFDNIYNFIRLIPLVALGVSVYYVINYSNVKRNE